jgi:hypothetical protein
MCHKSPLFTALSLLLLLGNIHPTQGADKPASKELSSIQPPGGVPLQFGRPGEPIKVDAFEKIVKRLDSAPAGELDKWVVELERLMDQKLEGELANGACRTYFVSRMSVAFDDLQWNAKSADRFLQRANSIPATEVEAWKGAFEALLKKEIGQTATTNHAGGPAYAVPLVLIPTDALYEGQKYSAERSKKYLARLKQLTAEDVSLWKDQVDQSGGTNFDAAVNIILLDECFDPAFQRETFKAAVEAGKK